MRKVGFALAIFMVAGAILIWQAGGVRADTTTGCEGTGNECSGDEQCAPGYCTAQRCCTTPPEPPSGGCTADYQCGSGNCCVNGACTSCGGGASQCNADYIVNCASGTKTQQIVNTQCVRIITACKESDGSVRVGTAQSLGGCCEEWDPDGDGNLNCRSESVYTFTCCPTGTVADCRPEGTNYERYNHPNLDEF